MAIIQRNRRDISPGDSGYVRFAGNVASPVVVNPPPQTPEVVAEYDPVRASLYSGGNPFPASSPFDLLNLLGLSRPASRMFDPSEYDINENLPFVPGVNPYQPPASVAAQGAQSYGPGAYDMNPPGAYDLPLPADSAVDRTGFNVDPNAWRKVPRPTLMDYIRDYGARPEYNERGERDRFKRVADVGKWLALSTFLTGGGLGDAAAVAAPILKGARLGARAEEERLFNNSLRDYKINAEETDLQNRIAQQTNQEKEATYNREVANVLNEQKLNIDLLESAKNDELRRFQIETTRETAKERNDIARQESKRKEVAQRLAVVKPFLKPGYMTPEAEERVADMLREVGGVQGLPYDFLRDMTPEQSQRLQELSLTREQRKTISDDRIAAQKEMQKARIKAQQDRDKNMEERAKRIETFKQTNRLALKAAPGGGAANNPASKAMQLFNSMQGRLKSTNTNLRQFENDLDDLKKKRLDIFTKPNLTSSRTASGLNKQGETALARIDEEIAKKETAVRAAQEQYNTLAGKLDAYLGSGLVPGGSYFSEQEGVISETGGPDGFIPPATPQNSNWRGIPYRYNPGGGNPNPPPPQGSTGGGKSGGKTSSQNSTGYQTLPGKGNENIRFRVRTKPR